MPQTLDVVPAAPVVGDEEALYREHRDALYRIVRAAIAGPDELVEDACQNAWLILLRRQPARGSVLPWLITVALREAYQLSRRERRDARLKELLDPDGSDVVAAPASLEQSLEARDALATLAALPPRQRRFMALFVAGYRYQEIVALCGVTYTNVNNQLVRARARLREQR